MMYMRAREPGKLHGTQRKLSHPGGRVATENHAYNVARKLSNLCPRDIIQHHQIASRRQKVRFSQQTSRTHNRWHEECTCPRRRGVGQVPDTSTEDDLVAIYFWRYRGRVFTVCTKPKRSSELNVKPSSAPTSRQVTLTRPGPGTTGNRKSRGHVRGCTRRSACTRYLAWPPNAITSPDSNRTLWSGSEDLAL